MVPKLPRDLSSATATKANNSVKEDHDSINDEQAEIKQHRDFMAVHDIEISIILHFLLSPLGIGREYDCASPNEDCEPCDDYDDQREDIENRDAWSKARTDAE